jgi:uncharacterized protein YecE (DUF72 family)
MRVATGTSGFSYKEWKGSFYPADLKNDGMLSYYASRLRAVEINNTFYRMPKETLLLGWAEQVPDTFTFVLKASQRITHFGRLKDVHDSVAYFLKTASVLGERLGPTLFQLPPNFKKDLPRLTAFLELLPRNWRAAFEFRHETWYDDDVYSALKAKNVALVAAEEDDTAAHVVPTADFGYLRLRKEAYTETELSTWGEHVRAQAWKDAFVFFKHEDGAVGPKLAEQFQQLLGSGA